MLLTVLVFLLILSVLVLIHEAGHYFTAKKFGIKVEEFGFGLPPRLWGKKIGETIYSLNWLPIGGFVKLYGEDEAGGGRIETKKKTAEKPKDIKRAYFMKPAWQRFLVVIAGIIMNALLAVVIYYVFLGVSGFKAELPLLGQHTFFLTNQSEKTQVVINDVAKGSPADKAGVTSFSQIISVNRTPVTSPEAFSKTIAESKGKELEITWKNLQTGKEQTAVMTPRVNAPEGEGALGVGFFPLSTVVLSYDTPVQKALSGFSHPANLMTYNFAILGDLISVAIEKKDTEPLRQSVSGPVGIGFAVGSIIEIEDQKERALQLLNLAGLLSISLAFFNFLPIPGLDGGRLFFIVIEIVFRRKINEKIEGYIHAVGMSLLLLMILFVTINDLRTYQNSIIGFFQNLLP
ncbi:MAG: M50 family metallopeptidase [Patescibacteria group bacterium]